jgi:dihydroorotase
MTKKIQDKSKKGGSENTGGKFDLVLKGGRVIDPSQDLDGVLDVGIRDGKIAAVGAGLKGSKKNIDVRGRLVLPGMIDSHAHVYQHVSGRFGLNPDMAGVRSGVTTLVDQGGPSCMTFPGFRKFIVEPSASRVLAFISIYVVGGRKDITIPISIHWMAWM